MMRYAFYSHGSCKNRGCEAIVKTISHLIKENSENSVVKLYTFDEEFDRSCSLPDIDEIEEFNYVTAPVKLKKTDLIKLSVLRRFSQKVADNYFYSFKCKNKTLKDNDVYISVGGDNYCYGDGHVAIAMNNTLRKLGKKTVLWGCSVSEEYLNEDKIKDIKKFDLIVVRESLSYDTLKKCGLNNNVRLYPDSAFTLEEDVEFKKKHILKKKTVGFNVHPTFSKNADSVFDNSVIFLRHLLDSTDYDILLVPHVVSPRNNEYDTLKKMSDILNSDRVTVLSSDYSASEYKSIISQCDIFIGSRTHSTIAAYSSCVPTLALGYSVKSKGIAKDIFGTYDGFVVNMDDLTQPDILINAFDDFYARKDEIKNHLEKVMPDYIQKSKESIKELFKI